MRTTVRARLKVSFAFLAASLVAFASAPKLQAEEDKKTIEDLSLWTNVFGGQKTEFQYRVADAGGRRAAWRLASNGRTLASGETKMTAGAGQPAIVKVRLTVPPVKEGVVLKARLTFSVFAEKSDTPAAAHEKAIWIFHRNPFLGRTDWLKSLKIVVFDPEKKTVKTLEQMKVPFEELGNVDSISELKAGVLIVGEGVSFRDIPSLPEALIRAAARGTAVLCLAPSAGTFPLPGTQNAKLPMPQLLSLRRAGVIHQLDKRLDSRAWAGGKMIASTLSLRGAEGMAQGEVAPDGGWPWLELAYGEPRGRLVVCGFGIIGQWDVSPSARFLFARLFTHLTEKAGPSSLGSSRSDP